MPDLRAPAAATVLSRGEGEVTGVAAGPAAPAWEAAVERLLAEPQRVRVHYAPIVDIQRGVVRGHEAVARVPEAPDLPAADAFAAAARLGRPGVLEAQVLTAVLTLRPLLPRDRVLSLTASPLALASAEMESALALRGRLDGLVVEVAADDGPGGAGALLAAVAALRDRGAAVAVRVTADGEPSAEHLSALAPRVLKVDGALARGVIGEPRRANELRDVLDLGRRLDASVVVGGIDTAEQLDALARLGVTLGTGGALGSPSATTGELDRRLARRLREATLRDVRDEGVARLVEPAASVPDGAPAAVADAFARDPRLERIVVVDGDRRPVGIVDRLADGRGEEPRRPLVVLAATAVEDVVRRAVARRLEERWDPVVCVDGDGGFVGLVTAERLLTTLALA